MDSQTCCINAQHIDQAPGTLRRSQRLKERREKQSANAPVLPTAGAGGGENLINARAATDRVGSDEQCIGRNNESITETGTENENPAQTTSEILLQWAQNKTIAPDKSDISETSDLLDELANPLEIKPDDYLADSEFSPIYNYLTAETLTGDKHIDRKTLLLAENYYVENGLLYKISLPRSQKQKRLRTEIHQLCIPKSYRKPLITNYHELLGHGGINKMHIMLIHKFYWKELISDIKQIIKTCEICQLSKIDTKHSVSPLFPLPVPARPFQCIAMDHKVLTRKTEAGHTHILTFVCHFSNYTIYVPVKSESAYTTARAYVENIVARYGITEIIISDRASGFMSIFFSTVAKLLNIRHRTSASGSSRSNGCAERAILKLNQGLKMYSTVDIDDTKIELILPIIQMSVLASPLTNIEISPHEIVHGYPMPLPTPLDQNIPTFLSRDAETYAHWLKHSIKVLHDAVRSNRLESKIQMKQDYDKLHKAKHPVFREGDKVYVKTSRIKPNSPRVLTKKPFDGPYLIKTIVQHDPTVGPAFKLVHATTGKEIKNLVGVDKLKKCAVTDESHDKLQSGAQKETTAAALSALAVTENIAANRPDDFRLGLRILRHRQNGGRREYLVAFANHLRKWCTTVGHGLISDYRKKQK